MWPVRRQREHNCLAYTRSRERANEPQEISLASGTAWSYRHCSSRNSRLRCLAGWSLVIENFWLNAAYSVTPTILIGLVFWFVMRSILRADRDERESYSKIEQEEREKRGLADPNKG